SQKKALIRKLRSAEQLGNIRLVKRILAVLALAEGGSKEKIATMLKVSVESVRLWLRAFLLQGLSAIEIKKPTGRPSELTKMQKKELAEIIDKGPTEAGFLSNCWRSPMIQHLIYKKYGVFYSVYYISQLLKNMGFSYQKARFVSDHLDEEARKQWLSETWPEILALAEKKKAFILFGDEASFPQWGTLSYTWATRGKQPTIKTSGKRKGYKIFGLIDYFTGRFFYKCQESRFNSESYIQFIKEVLSKTKKHIILIQDGAKYHTSVKTRKYFAQRQDRLTVYNLPSYSPDYNPIEKLWKKVKKEGTHLHYFPTFQDLVDKVEEALMVFKNTAKEILSLFGLYDNLLQPA
ncbi:MAG: IS630 family transposase, partial [Thermodesulfobacteriota bacterium]|nr:IS630 family transposase [Thermodesulfobacteriota bacterium]